MDKKENLKDILSQFKSLDPKDPSLWPRLPKVVMTFSAVCLIFIAGYFADWSGQLEELDVGSKAGDKLKAEYIDKYRQSVNLDLYKKQLKEVNQLLVSMLRQLPNRSQMDTLINDINNAGTSHKLQFELFKPSPQELKNDIYAELPISIKVLGRYHDMGAFVAEIGQLSRIVTINDLVIGSTTSLGLPSDSLFMEATAKTFRYLDEEELALAKSMKAKKNKPSNPVVAAPPASSHKN